MNQLQEKEFFMQFFDSVVRGIQDMFRKVIEREKRKRVKGDRVSD